MPTTDDNSGDSRTIFAARLNSTAACSRLRAALKSWLFGLASGPTRNRSISIAVSTVFAFLRPREMIARLVPCGLSKIRRKSSFMNSAIFSGSPTNRPSGILRYRSHHAMFLAERVCPPPPAPDFCVWRLAFDIPTLRASEFAPHQTANHRLGKPVREVQIVLRSLESPPVYMQENDLFAPVHRMAFAGQPWRR